MVLCKEVDLNFLETTSFEIAKDQFKTLGATATKEHGKQLTSNWESKVQQLKQNIPFCNTPPISMVGHSNTLKMAVLPRFLYIFQNIPVVVPLGI